MYSPEERVADSIVHVIGIAAALVAVGLMLVAAVRELPAASAISVAIYGTGMLAMFACSAAYNLISNPRWRGALQRLDHAAIFIKIAGTYTPFGVLLGGLAGSALLAGVWTIALLGAGTKLIKTNWKGIDIPVYLLLGWAVVLVVHPLAQAVSPLVLVLLVLGGALYSLGVIFHVWRSLKYHNAIWHGFVLIATACHFGAVTSAVFA